MFQASQAGARLGERLEPGGCHRDTQFRQGPLHQAEVDAADELVVSFGQFQERAVPQPDHCWHGGAWLGLGLKAELVQETGEPGDGGLIGQVLERRWRPGKEAAPRLPG
jgi:hypothetical protein